MFDDEGTVAPIASTSTLVGRADLVHALARLEESSLSSVSLDRVAERLGYFDDDARSTAPRTTVSPERSKKAGAVIEDPDSSGESSIAEDDTEALSANVPFWRIDRITTYLGEGRGDVFAGVDPLRLPEFGLTLESVEFPSLPSKPLKKRPIAPWSRLLSPLRRALRRDDLGDVDVEALVDRWSHGERIDEIPRERRRGWSSRAVVVLDLSERLVPFWDDQEEFVARLTRAVGPIDLRVMPNGVTGAVTRHGLALPEGLDDLMSARQPVLVISDLGHYGDAATRRQWRRFGERWRRAGVRVSTLAPVPADRLQAKTVRDLGVTAWETGSSVASIDACPSPSVRAIRAERLLRLFSVATCVDRGLLRDVRRLLASSEADVGVEADVWNHPAVCRTDCRPA